MRLPQLIAFGFCIKVIGLFGQTPPPAPAYTNADFALRMHRELVRLEPNANLVWSPISLQSVLAVMAEGARGKTADELGVCLGLPLSARRSGDLARPWDFTSFHQANHAAIEALRAPWSAQDDAEARRLYRESNGKPDRLTRAKMEELTASGWDGLGPYQPFVFRSVDRLVVQKGLPLEQDFQGVIRGHYPGGVVESVDFQGSFDSERRRMNAWITQQTDGIIKDPIPSDAWTAATRLVSVNVTYLRADWSRRFDPKETRPGKFFAFGEKSVLLVPTMSHNEDCRYVALNRDGSIFPTPDKVPAGSNDADISFYPKEGGYHVIERPYAGQRASMVMVLPTRFQRLNELEAALTPAQLEVILRGGKERSCVVQMPKFKTRTAASLLAPLALMGVTALSNGNAADLTGMCRPTPPERSLYLQGLAQVTDIEVNERGTVAVSTTFASGAWGGVGVGPPMRPFVPQFIANQAFLYFIKDNATGQILFVGRMVNPLR